MHRFSLFILLFVFVTLSASAQFTKGQLMPGITAGSVFFNSGKTEYTAPAPTTGYTSSSNSAGFSLAPSLGWFISNRTVVGGRINANFLYEKYIDASNNVTFRKREDRTTQWGLGGFIRNYFTETGRLLPFAQLGVDGGIGMAKTEGFNYTSTYRDQYKGKSKNSYFFNTGVSAGVTRMLGAQVGLDVAFGYTFSYKRQKFETTTNRDADIDGTIDEVIVSNITTATHNHGFSISAGLQVFLGRKK